jgi:hypothetical protein
MKIAISILVVSLLVTACASGPKPVVTLTSFDNTGNGTGTIDDDGTITITIKDKIYKGKDNIDGKKQIKKNNPAVKYKRGTGNGTAILKSGSSALNCEFNQDEDSAMGYCKDSAGKEFDVYAK